MQDSPRARRPQRLVRGRTGAVSTAHPRALEAGTAILSAGGSALDAALAAQAVVCVAMPQAAGLGGDLLCLVRDDRHQVLAVNGTGTSPRAATLFADTGGASVTVPGLVDAWIESHRRWGRLPLSTVLTPAITAARDGVVVDRSLSLAVDAQRDRLMQGGAESWALLDRAAGDVWRQPELADLLTAIAAHGAEAFYRGSAASSLAASVQHAGGALTENDLAEHRTVVADPISVEWDSGTVRVQPPASQGVLLALALQQLQRRWPEVDSATLHHILVELTGAAFEHRSACADPSLLSRVLNIDPNRSTRRRGPRAYLHTAATATVDARGMVVSSLVSVFDDFGSGVFVPSLGIVLNNRVGGFTVGPNAPAAGARPVHTLAPTLAEFAGGGVLALATPGADGQVQTLLQILAAMRDGASLGEAVAAPRWRSQDVRLMVEADHPHLTDLAERGHDVLGCPPGADLFGAVAAAGTDGSGPFALADWRRSTCAGAV